MFTSCLVDSVCTRSTGQMHVQAPRESGPTIDNLLVLWRCH